MLCAGLSLARKQPRRESEDGYSGASIAVRHEEQGGYRQADQAAVWSQPRGQDGGLAGMTFNFATRSVELEAPLSRADWKKSDKSLNLSPQPPSSHLPHTAASSTTLRLPSEQQ